MRAARGVGKGAAVLVARLQIQHIREGGQLQQRSRDMGSCRGSSHGRIEVVFENGAEHVPSFNAGANRAQVGEGVGNVRRDGAGPLLLAAADSSHGFGAHYARLDQGANVCISRRSPWWEGDICKSKAVQKISHMMTSVGSIGVIHNESRKIETRKRRMFMLKLIFPPKCSF